MLEHAARHVRLLHSVQLLSPLLAIPAFLLDCVQLHVGTILDHSALECFHDVFAALL